MPDAVWREASAVKPGWWVEAAEADWRQVEHVSVLTSIRRVDMFFVGGDFCHLSPSELIRTRTVREMARTR